MLHRTIQFILIVVLFTVTPLWASGQTIDPSDVKHFADNFFDTKLEEYHVPGVVFIMIKDDKIIYSQGYGYTNIEKKIKPDPGKSIYRVASNSKLFIATAVMQLYEKGKIDLDTDVNVYMDKKVIPGDSYPPVTLRHLLTHTAGFDDINVRMSTLYEENRLSLEEFITQRVPDRVYPPGVVTSYSNYGYALAGYIVERVSGQPYHSYIDNNILKSLGMNQSGFFINKPLIQNLATPYVYIDNDFRELPYDYIHPYPVAALMTTAKDMASFMIMHLNDGRHNSATILDKSTAWNMHKQQFTNHKELPGMSFGYIEDMINGIRVLTHGGWTAGYKTTQVLIPSKNTGYFISGNYEYPSGNQYKIYDEFRELFFNKFYPGKNNVQVKNQFSTAIEIFEGNYRNNRYDRDTIAKLGILLNDLKVKVHDESSIKIKNKIYTRKDNLLFMENEGNAAIGFRLNDQENPSFLFKGSNPTVGYEMLSWYETSSFHMLIIGICVILFLTSPVIFYILYKKNDYSALPKPGFPRVPYLLASANGIALVLFFAAMGLVLLSTVQISLWWQTPPIIPYLLLIPLISIPCTLYMIYLVVRNWKASSGFLVERIYFTILTTAFVAFLLFLNYFNLVGYYI